MNQYKIAISKIYEETETRTIVYHRVIKFSEFPMGLQPRSLSIPVDTPCYNVKRDEPTTKSTPDKFKFYME